MPLDEQLLYLNGLALVINVDGDIHEREKEYLQILIKSFAMDESTLDSFIAFSQAPDKDVFQDFIKAFRRRPLAQVYLFDAYMMAGRDDNVCKKERLLIEKIANGLEILKGTQQDIFDLFCHIKHRNWQESALYFDSHLLNPEHFKHLLSYYEVELRELLDSTKKIRQVRLQQVLENKIGLNRLEWIPLEGVAGKEITKEYVSPLITMFDHNLIMPYLQACIDRGEMKVLNTKIYHIKDGKEHEICTLTSIGMTWGDEEEALVSVDTSKFNLKVIEEFLVYCKLTNNISGVWLISNVQDLLISLSDAHLGQNAGKCGVGELQKLRDQSGWKGAFVWSINKEALRVQFARNMGPQVDGCGLRGRLQDSNVWSDWESGYCSVYYKSINTFVRESEMSTSGYSVSMGTCSGRDESNAIENCSASNTAYSYRLNNAGREAVMKFGFEAVKNTVLLNPAIKLIR